MEPEIHPVATHHVPSFITAPGETDVLMAVMSVVLAGSVLAFGILFLRLHSLPERMAHKSKKIQFEIVAVLCLIALFTHMHIFWVAGLLLAFIDLPDFGGSLDRIAGSTEKLAGLEPGQGAFETETSPSGDSHPPTPKPEIASGNPPDDAFTGPRLVPTQRDLTHA